MDPIFGKILQGAINGGSLSQFLSVGGVYYHCLEWQTQGPAYDILICFLMCWRKQSVCVFQGAGGMQGRLW